jgi:hypothetical protein
LFAEGHLYAQCKAPHYHALDSLKAEKGVSKIVIKPRDLTIDGLICLTQDLKARHSEWLSKDLVIFTSHDAAKSFLPGPRVELPALAVRAQSQVHAVYTFNRETREEHLDILPYGWTTARPDATTLNLPVKEAPPCRFEVHGRCLMALKELDYPYDALRSEASGSATLVGTIRSDGRISGIEVQDAAVGQGEAVASLVEGAKQNLASWQLEARRGQDVIRITYSYVIDRSLGQYLVNADIALPDRIVIRGNPWAIPRNP